MKRFFSIIFLLILFLCSEKCFAAEFRVLVLPDNLEVQSTNYYVYPECAEILSTDIINYLNRTGIVEAPTLSRIKHDLDSTPYVKKSIKEALKRFKYMYNIDFIALDKVAKRFRADKVLLVTSGIDAQSYISRRSLWDFLNIPGTSPIDPAYKMTTNLVLIDTQTEEILWQATYRRDLSWRSHRIVPNNFGPAYEQLEKIKMYSGILSPQVAQTVRLTLKPYTEEELYEIHQSKLYVKVGNKIHDKWQQMQAPEAEETPTQPNEEQTPLNYTPLKINQEPSQAISQQQYSDSQQLVVKKEKKSFFFKKSKKKVESTAPTAEELQTEIIKPIIYTTTKSNVTTVVPVKMQKPTLNNSPYTNYANSIRGEMINDL